MDDADFASDRIDKETSSMIKTIRSRKTVIEGNGVCLFCNGIVNPTMTREGFKLGRWCSPDCRDTWSNDKRN